MKTLVASTSSTEPLAGTASARFRRPWLAALLLAVLTALVYARTFHAQFVAVDDQANITTNKHINPPSWSGLKKTWTMFYFQYCPLSYMVWAADSWLAIRTLEPGTQKHDDLIFYADDPLLDPRVFHATNIALHATCVMLVFAALRQLVGNDRAAFLGALLFAWHPVQVQSVAWISELRSPLAGTFSFAAIYFYLRFRHADDGGALVELWGQDVDPPGSRALSLAGRRAMYALASICFLLALLSKAAAASVPLIVMTLEVIFYRRTLSRTLLLFGWWCLPVIVLGVAMGGSQSEFVAAHSGMMPAWWQRPLVALYAIAFYLLKLFLPLGLTLDYGLPIQHVLQSGWLYVAWILPVSLLALAAWLPGRRAWVSACFIFAAVALPTAGLISRAVESITIVADHYIYLGVFAAGLVLAWLLAHTRLRGFSREAALLICLLGLLTFMQTGYWYNTRTLAEHMLDVYPGSAQARILLARLYVSEDNPPAAERMYREAYALNPDQIGITGRGNVRTNLGWFLIDNDRPDEGAPLLVDQVLADDEDDLKRRLWLLDYYFAQRDFYKVMEEAHELIELAPTIAIRGQLEIDGTQRALTVGHLRLAGALYNFGRFQEALEHCEQSLLADSQNTEAHAVRAEVLVRLERYQAALDAYEIVLKRQPENTHAQAQIAALRQLLGTPPPTTEPP